MNLKKIILGFTIAAFVTAPVFAATNNATKAFIAQYKAKNYLGCIQSTEAFLKKNPSDIYAHYYKGLAYSQLGKKDLAKDSFTKVITLNSNPVVVKNAEKGIACLTSSEACTAVEDQLDDFDKFLYSNKFYTEKVQSEINQKKLDKMRQEMNEQVSGEAIEKKSEAPTNEEIANAVRTLAKVGFNPMNNMNMYQSPEMMQMDMLLGNNNNNNNGFNNMLPYLLMSQNQEGAAKLSPELMQTMMMSQMQMY